MGEAPSGADPAAATWEQSASILTIVLFASLGAFPHAYRRGRIYSALEVFVAQVSSALRYTTICHIYGSIPVTRIDCQLKVMGIASKIYEEKENGQEGFRNICVDGCVELNVYKDGFVGWLCRWLWLVVGNGCVGWLWTT